MADDRRHCRACDALSRRAASERDGLCTACEPEFYDSPVAKAVASAVAEKIAPAIVDKLLDGPFHPDKPGCPNTPECDDYCAGFADGRASAATPPAAETRHAITAGFSLKFCAGCGSQISPAEHVRYIVTGGTFERECCSKVCAQRLLEPYLPKPPADPDPPKAA
jgi:hypothetical protein